MSSFVCPHNDDTVVNNKCSILECPYNMHRVTLFFNYSEEEIKTNCCYFDTDLMVNITENKSQISNLLKNPRKNLNTRVINGIYEETIKQFEFYYYIHNEIDVGNTCKKCGYPLDSGKTQCTSKTLCNDRLNWVSYILSLYKIQNNIFKRQIVWNLFIKNKVLCEKVTKENGIQLLTPKDAEIMEKNDV